MLTRIATCLLAGLMLLTPTTTSAGPTARTPRTFGPSSGAAEYIVQLTSPPLASYMGGLGPVATSPLATGEAQLATSSPAAVAYQAYLRAERNQVTSAAASALDRPLQIGGTFEHALNGFWLTMNAAEADRLGSVPGVAAVWRSVDRPLHTDSGPEWIGAPAVWDGSALSAPKGFRGEGVIVGIIDTGINMDHPSFAAEARDGYVHENPLDGYVGLCDPEHPDHDPERHRCNAKLIGAWSFEASGGDPEDDHGHGSHTASIAAGNPVEAGLRLPFGLITQEISGVAPRANLIAYDACFVGDYCPDVATAAAIDQAVADGVDVLNYSIGTDGNDLWRLENPVMTAFRNARAAGVLVAASAGNAGPDPGTVNAVAPWMVATGAVTHHRSIDNALTDFEGGAEPLDQELIGAGQAGGYGPAPVVHARDHAHADGSVDDGGCQEPFAPDAFDGAIVVCNGRSSAGTKEFNVRAGGAAGLVLANLPGEGEGLIGSTHMLPTVNIGHSAARVLGDWLSAGEGHTARITGTRFNHVPDRGDRLARFSSRGPSAAGYCCLRPDGPYYAQRRVDLLKPDVSAPGVEVWAAVKSPPGSSGDSAEFGFLSGTSMASPHVAGAMALLRGVHPDWTAAEVQSALTLTAAKTVTGEDGRSASPLEVGAGRIDVAAAARSGVVLDLTNPLSGDPMTGGEASGLNLASLTDFNCLGRCSWQRTLRSAADRTVSWDLTVTADPDLALAVEPESLLLEPGATAVITVSADVGVLPEDTHAFGQVRLEPDVETVAIAEMPVTVRAAAVRLPPDVISELPPISVITARGTEGRHAMRGFRLRDTAVLDVTPAGFVPATVVVDRIGEDPSNDNPFNADGGTFTVLVDVPEGASRLVAEVTASEASDIDLYVGPDTDHDGAADGRELACVSGIETFHEYCDLRDLTPGRYWILVQNWLSESDQSSDRVELRYGVVGQGGEGLEVTVPDGAVTAGAPFDVTADWSVAALSQGDVYYGGMALRSPDGELVLVGIDLVGVAADGTTLYLPDLRHRETLATP